MNRPSSRPVLFFAEKCLERVARLGGATPAAWWLAILTLGEGWHNNHHHYPGAARQGFFWWEIDLTYYGLRLLAALGLISDLKLVPAAMLHARGARQGASV